MFERPADVLLDSPFVMVGARDALVDHVRQLRDRHEVSYITVPERSAEAFATVMELVR